MITKDEAQSFLQERIRPRLEMMEDTIMTSLFKRSLLKRNLPAYEDKIKIGQFTGTFFEYLLRETENLHAKAGRYQHPEEIPFSSGLSFPILVREYSDEGIELANVDLNLNPKISYAYFSLLDSICEDGSDKRFGTSVVQDITCLQELSKRIHDGRYVAEVKFWTDPEGYRDLIDNHDTEGIIGKLTNKEVERKVLSRVRSKGERYNLDPTTISDFYENQIIPLTIEAEVQYFLQRGSGDVYEL